MTRPHECITEPTPETRAPLALVAQVLTEEGILFHTVSAAGKIGLEVAVRRGSGFTYLVHWFPCGASLEVEIFLPIASIGDWGEELLRAKIARLNERFRGELIFHYERVSCSCLYRARLFQRRILQIHNGGNPLRERIRSFLPVIDEIASGLGIFADTLETETTPRGTASSEACIN